MSQEPIRDRQPAAADRRPLPGATHARTHGGPPSSRIDALRQRVGNRELQRLLGGGAAQQAPAVQAGALLPTLPTLPTLPAPCTPATSLTMAQALHAFVSSSFIPYARGMFGPQTASLWANYLDVALPAPRPARAFSGAGEIVQGFTGHHRSAEAQQRIVDASVAALRGPAFAHVPAAGTTRSVPVTDLVPASTLRTRINDPADPMGLRYDSPATTIPGNIAGGIGAGGPPGGPASADTRGVMGTMRITADPAGTSLTLRPVLTFSVHDTVDFCPGNLGGRVARAETVPMSILEATGARFGPVFAADVPFDVDYPGPAAATTIPTPPVPPAPPLPVVPRMLRIHFNLDRPRQGGSSLSDSLDASGSASLATLIGQLRREPGACVQLVGRASPDGTAAYNLDLGARRASMIARALHAAGIARARIATAPAVPLASGCAPVAPGVFTCGESGTAGAPDREVRAYLFAPAGAPPGPAPPGAAPSQPGPPPRR